MIESHVTPYEKKEAEKKDTIKEEINYSTSSYDCRYQRSCRLRTFQIMNQLR